MALTQVSTGGVKDDAITKAKIPANQIEASELADNAVDTNAIANGAVSNAKIVDGAINNAKVVSDAAIAGSKLADNTITTAKIADDAITQAKINVPLTNRNIIRNGHMQVIQRGTPLSVNANIARGRTCADGWEVSSGANGTAVFSSSKSTDTPNGFGSSLKLDVTTADTSIAADVNTKLLQRFEGQDLQDFKKGSSDALQFTLSFYVKSPKTGTHIIELLDIDNNRSVSATYTVSQANTWQYVAYTFPADTSGALDNNNGQSFIVLWWLAAGSDFSSGTLNTTWNSRVEANRAVGQVNITDSTANNFYLTGCQLEVGSTATNFQYKSFAEELALCQRYCYVWKSSQAYSNMGTGYMTSSTNVDLIFNLPQIMRASPSFSNSGSFRIVGYEDNTQNAQGLSSFSIQRSHPHTPYLRGVISGGLTAGVGEFGDNGVNNATAIFSAEL